MTRVECPQCGNAYKRLSTHWIMNARCEFPEITEKQKEILQNPPAGIYIRSHKEKPQPDKKPRHHNLVIMGKNGAYKDLCRMATVLDYIMRPTHNYHIPGSSNTFYHMIYTRTHPDFKEILE